MRRSSISILAAAAMTFIVAWQLTPVRRAAPAVAPPSAASRSAAEDSVYYPNCDAARAAGAAPIYRGSPGYREGLDGDDDGIACEPPPLFRRRW
jgi:hypothetical protein